MFNLIKKLFNKNKKVTPNITSDRLINGVIEFIQSRKENIDGFTIIQGHPLLFLKRPK